MGNLTVKIRKRIYYPFFPLPHKLLEMPLSMPSFCLYTVLSSLANINFKDPGIYTIRRSKLMKFAKIKSPTTFHKALKELIDLNMLVVESGKEKGKANTYILTDPNEWKEGVHLMDTPVQQMDTPIQQMDTVNKENINKEEIYKETTTRGGQIEKIRNFSFGQLLTEKEIGRILDKFDYESVLEAVKVLSWQLQNRDKEEIRDPVGYIKQILREGLDIPRDYEDPDDRKKFAELLERISEYEREFYEYMDEITEAWSKADRTEKIECINETLKIAGIKHKEISSLKIKECKKEQIKKSIFRMAQLLLFRRKAYAQKANVT